MIPTGTSRKKSANSGFFAGQPLRDRRSSFIVDDMHFLIQLLIGETPVVLVAGIAYAARRR